VTWADACHKPRRAGRLLILLALAWPLTGAGETDRRWACEAGAKPPYAAPGALNLATLREGEPTAAIRPPDCSNWVGWGSSLVVALAASFRAEGGADAILASFAAVSSLRGIRYWSVSDKRWQTLIADATALAGPDARLRRSDFSVAELKSGRDLYFAQADNRSSGKVVYRMRLTKLGPDRFVISVENVTGVWLFVLPLFAPGDLHSLYVLRQLSPGLWGYYGLSGIREGAAGLFGSDRASLINRAAAVYRHIAGIPTDQEPPAAR
jgi:hypothetical protein